MAVPSVATITPPSAGPTLRARLKHALLSIVAAGMSSRGTMSPMEDCHAGLFSAVPHPIRKVKASRSHGPIRPNQASTARPVDAASMKPWAISMTTRRSWLSEIAPAASENSMTGSVVEACTSAIMTGEGAIVAISHAAATAWISPPKLETRLAIQTSRKIGWRSGANGEAYGELSGSSASTG